MKPCIERDCGEYAVKGPRCPDCYTEFERGRRNDPGLTGRRGTTPAWRRLRLQVLARDRWACVVCNVSYGLEVHHVDHDATNDALDNLETRCRDCHRDSHAVT